MQGAALLAQRGAPRYPSPRWLPLGATPVSAMCYLTIYLRQRRALYGGSFRRRGFVGCGAAHGACLSVICGTMTSSPPNAPAPMTLCEQPIDGDA